MNSNEINILKDIYDNIFQNGDILLNRYDNKIDYKTQINEIQNYCDNTNLFNNKLKEILKLSENILHECYIKKEEISNIDNNIHMTWGDLSENSDNRDILTDKINENIKSDLNSNNKSLECVYNIPLNYKYIVPIIKNLNDIPLSYYWYCGDSNNPEGIYTRISKDVCILVPMPDVIDGSKDYNRSMTSKCKYKTKTACLESCKLLSNKFKSDMRKCNFAHIGDKYNKICYSNRCNNILRFGSHKHLAQDIKNIDMENIKNMMMYALSDVLLGSIWTQKNIIKSQVITDLDVCT